MNYVSDNMNYLTTHGILHHVLENAKFYNFTPMFVLLPIKFYGQY